MKEPKAVVVFSGGQDSTTCLKWAMNRFFDVLAITFFYHQKHQVEIEVSKEICHVLDVRQTIVDISFFQPLVLSALVQKNGDFNSKHVLKPNLPASFVPNRNALFLTVAHAFAQTVNAQTLVIGVCETDYSGYPDCRMSFIDEMQTALNMGAETNIEILTPLMYLSKSEIFALAEREGVLELVLKSSHTCYNGSRKMNQWGAGCGICPACKLRARGFFEWSMIAQSKCEKGRFE